MEPIKNDQFFIKTISLWLSPIFSIKKTEKNSFSLTSIFFKKDINRAVCMDPSHGESRIRRAD